MAGVEYPITLVAVALGAAVYQLLVTVRLIRFAGYSLGQKLVQSLLIWLFPLIGALVVHIVIRGTEKRVLPADRNFTPQGPQSVG